ncbi:hypothetical protein ACHAWO_005755, partial [Cyclotella atomus]
IYAASSLSSRESLAVAAAHPSTEQKVTCAQHKIMTKKKSTMAKIDLMFGFILLWSIVSTSLLVMHHYRIIDDDGKLSPKNIKSGLAQDETRRMKQGVVRKGKRRRDEMHDKKRGKADKMTDHKIHFSIEPKQSVKLLPEEQYNLSSGNNEEFPFTRSLKTFDSSDNFYIYTVNAASSDDAAALQWSEVPWKQLVHKWNPSTTFVELVNFGSALQQQNADAATSSIAKKLVIHCLPKTASTTLRDACKRLMDKKCPGVPERHDPYGYRNPTEFYHAVKTCTEVHQFCVQGGDLLMNVIGYSGKDDDDDEEKELEVKEAENTDTVHFVHLVPFRNFNEWAASALKQIYVVDGKCDRIDEMLEQCLGYRELYMELYTKSVLAGLIGMSLDANTSNDDNPWRKHEHHIVLYNYEDTSTIVSEMSTFFGIDPMPRTSADLKGKRSGGTCPEETLNTFHQCHDETLNNMDAIRDFGQELARRKKEERTMKKILADFRKKEGKVPEPRKSKAAKRKVNDIEDNDEERTSTKRSD